MSRGHITIGLRRTLTVDSLMVAQSWISTAYNITVDVQRSVLKPHTSNILVKIVGREFISGYPSHCKSEELRKKKAASLYATCIHLCNHQVFRDQNPKHQLSLSASFLMNYNDMSVSSEFQTLCFWWRCIGLWERTCTTQVSRTSKPILEVYVMQKYPGANHFSMTNPTTNLKQIFQTIKRISDRKGGCGLPYSK